jgi:hypothetical protein
MNLEGRQKIVSIAIVPHEEIDENAPLDDETDVVEGEENTSSSETIDTSLPSNEGEE